MLGLLGEATVAATEESDAERGRLRRAAVTTAREQFLPRFLAKFRTRHRGAEILLEAGNRTRVAGPNRLVVVGAGTGPRLDRATSGAVPPREVSLAEGRPPSLAAAGTGFGPRSTAEEPPVSWAPSRPR